MVRSFYQMEQEHNLILMLVVLLLVLASFRDFVAKFLQLTPPLLIKQESYSAVYPPIIAKFIRYS